MKRITEKEDIYIKSDGECEYKLTSSNDGIAILKCDPCDPIEIMSLDKATEKLHEILEIEDELGIELITLFKALKYGVYYFTSQNQLTHDYVWLYDNYVSASVRDRLSYSLLTCFQKQILSFEDYGKTWGFDKTELECGENGNQDY